MKGCTVIAAGFYSSLQDEGRFGYRHWGIPVSGPMDVVHFHHANALVGNLPNATAIECTLEGPRLLCNCDTTFAVAGAPMKITKNEKEVPMNTPISCVLGDILSFGKMTEGMRSYIAFAGGVQTEIFFGSRSYFHPVSPQATLEKGQSLPLKDPDKQLLPKEILLPPAWSLEAVVKINTTTGPDWHSLSKSIQKALKTGTYIVGSNNRMGYQLEGGSITHQLQLPSSFVLAGTLQLTPKGKLLVAMADGQVTGGYPRALLLEEASTAALAQARSGAKVKITVVDP